MLLFIRFALLQARVGSCRGVGVGAGFSRALVVVVVFVLSHRLRQTRHVLAQYSLAVRPLAGGNISPTSARVFLA